MSEQRLPAAQAVNELDFISHSPAQTERVGQRLGEHLRRGDLLLLVGSFGAGKTCLARGVARGLGATEPVTSPGSALVRAYSAGQAPGTLPIYHLDLFPLASAVELPAFLAELWAGGGVCLVERPEAARALLPAEHLAVHIQHLSETKRRLRLAPRGPRYVALVGAFKGGSFM